MRNKGNTNLFSGSNRGNYRFYLLGIIVLTSIGACSFVNFLLFHTIAEIFSVIIACSIFVVAWNTRQISSNNYLLFLGIAYLFVGFIDLTHTLAYKGMNIFVGYDANLPTQLWIGNRYLESISLIIAPIFFTRRLNVGFTFLAFLSICTLFLASVFAGPVFPDCFVEGSGLTTFKIISEYIISLILVGAIVVLSQRRHYLEKSVFYLITASLLATIISELAFTFYISVYGISNLVGHIFKIISFFLVYDAVIVVTLKSPYNSLFLKIVESEKAKGKIIAELEEAMNQVKQLQGFLPICASCKKIRDDKGYWQQIEQYIGDHSEATFSHGICPECKRKLYAEIYSKKGEDGR
jgi:hypothetical protein